ncbi:hypothetical protein [Cuneatibacter caecimuris]|uniref:Uncharacterized protein n=1 Tax=Cuneatibacter caecimuris TaxID=1796618 RepID=A0A4Q7PJR7_9FIRM|nr:hypothetical protein [Cuneatibacter caecimuris]RZT00934.1 hypothetical protein EV209_1370 [Cuneatibacter caecimuris]
MKKATFQEYTEAKKEIMAGGECKEYTSTDEYERFHKVICCEDGNNFWEVTWNEVTEFWSTKYPESRKYEVERELAKDTGTNMNQERYQKLANMCDTEHMTDADARLYIGQVLGFDPLKVKIVHEVSDYYIEEGRLKKWHTYHRDPQYNASDWNYIRFDVCGWQYEYENGMIRFYNS